jgi:hypothetical protein
VPSGASPSGVAFMPIIPSQYTSYRTGDEGWRAQNGWFDYTPPATPKTVARLNYANANNFNVLQDPLVVNGVSSTVRFVDVNGVQVFTTTGNANLVVIDKLTGRMYYRISLSARSWNACIDDALSFSVTVNSILYDDWFLGSSNEVKSIFHDFAGVNPEVDTLSAVTLLPISGNYFTATTDANNTSNAMWYSRAARSIRPYIKSENLNPIFVRDCKNLITAP